MTATHADNANPFFAPLKPGAMALPWLWVGTWSMGGSGFGKTDLSESSAVLQRAFQAGVRHFDTAGFYAKGRSEALIAQALGKKRQSIFIATKGGLVWEGNKVRHRGSPKSLRRSLEESLFRLKTDYIDLYQLHWPDPDVALEESFGALEEMKTEGLIRFVGACNLDADELGRCTGPGDRTFHQVHHNPIHRADHLLWAGAEGDRCTNCVISPLEQGLLASGHKAGGLAALGKRDVRRRNRYFGDPATAAWLSRYQALTQDCVLEKVTLILLWILACPGAHVIIPGPRTLRQLDQVLDHKMWLKRFGANRPADKSVWPDAFRTLIGEDLWRFLDAKRASRLADKT